MKDTNKLLKTILKPPVIPYEVFHELTKNKGIIQTRYPKAVKTIQYKGYDRLVEISLPKPKLPNLSLKRSLIKRKSTRAFSKDPLSIVEISTLLFWAAGINRNEKNRFYPSAGAKYPLEVYLLTTNSKLQPGLYHYYVKNNSLEQLLEFKKFDYTKYFVEKWVKDAGNVVLITGIFKRSAIKYGMKGYRHSLIETGHIAQNLYLISASLDLSCCEMAGFLDDKLHKLLDIDGKEEAILTTMAVGKKSALD